MESTIKTVILSAIIGALVGGGVVLFTQNSKELSEKALIKEFYEVENAVHISPHHIRKAMDKGDDSFILVDLRSQEEYEEEHIIGAVNIPAYKTPDESAYGDVERIVGSFQELKNENPKKEIIVYCYSIPCMTGRKIGKMLADNDIYVKHLGVGWNEWRYFWTLWNHPREWETTNVEDYVISGKKPGVPKIQELPSPCGDGEFDC